MAIHRTTNHEEIRAWIEENGGEPAVIRGAKLRGGEGMITVAFGSTKGDIQKINWQEFFDTFEVHNLRFRYEKPVPKGEAGWDYGFEDRDAAIPGKSDETELPQNFTGVDQDVEQNMFSSAPADGKDEDLTGDI